MQHKVSLANKVFTENPLLDEIVYNARQLATGVIVKDPDAADAGETLESMQAGDVLIAIKNGSIHFDNFQYDRDLLSKYYKTEESINWYAEHNDEIPEDDRKSLLKIACEVFLESYEEENPYYRMLNGLPTYIRDDRTGVIIWKGVWIDASKINDMGLTSLQYVSLYEKEGYTLIHELSPVLKNTLYETGTCEAITNAADWLAQYEFTKKDVMYLMHIGDREVDFYDARAAEKFALLYCPGCDSEEVRVRFKDLYEANRMYLLYTMYQEAYKYKSDYYNNFMMIFLIIQTIIDMVVELPEYIIRRDIFDTRTCKYIFESNGVKYFKDIPLKYQVSLVKNLNKLIKFKSTDKCIVDIISIFGVENMEVFRYYIMKDHKVESVKDPGYYANVKEVTDSTGAVRIEEDNDKNYDIRFIKVPMLGKYDEHIRTNSNITSYESMTDGDSSWRGDKEYEDVLSGIKDLDFTVLRSKYYSIEAVIDLTNKNFMLVYFMNILMYNGIDKHLLRVNLPNVSTTKKFELVDAILAMYSIGYIYYGVEDTILDSRSKAAQILGFNLEADLGKISSWLAENHMGLTLEDLKVNFSVPEEGKIMSFNQLENLFLTNKDCYDHIRSVMADPPSKEIYNAYRYLYKALMTTNRNMEFFIVGDRGIVDEYKKNGYKVKFINIPKVEEYRNPEDFERDYKWLLESIDDNNLCFVMNEFFDDNHLFDLYIKKDGDLLMVGSAKMAYTYREYLRYKDVQLYGFISDLVAIPNAESRREACVNAIQTISSYLKDYIDQDIVNIDTVLSGLPSISLDFIKRYVEEVIDFFKSFKIFTHGSSIVYTITDKYDNYVQLIDHILLKYLFDKSDIIKIEDALGGKVEKNGSLLLKKGNGIRTDLTNSEKITMIDKVWLDISTWIEKNYKEFYNSDKYKEASCRIKDSIERASTYVLSDKIMDSKKDIELGTAVGEITKLLIDVVDIVSMNVDVSYNERTEVKETLGISHNRTFKEFYNLWIQDLMSIISSMKMNDKMRYQDDYFTFDIYDFYTKYHILDGKISTNQTMSNKDKVKMHEDLYSIVTQEFPPHVFE